MNLLECDQKSDIEVLIEANYALLERNKRLVEDLKEKAQENLQLETDKSNFLLWRSLWLNPWIVIIPLVISFGLGCVVGIKIEKNLDTPAAGIYN